ncbi:MAG TPA: BON domain-containing protein [Usitatibacter sp.]|jgi:osmotically-inducible protein OsmY
MKSHLAIAALAAAFAAPLALAQPDHAAQPAPAHDFVKESVASSAVSRPGPDAQLANGIVQALNDDPSLKDSKIAVLAEDGKVWLTGATMTRAQKEQVSRIVTAQAGEGNVVNVILDSET